MVEVPFVGVGEEAEFVGGFEGFNQSMSGVDGGEDVAELGDEVLFGDVEVGDLFDLGEELVGGDEAGLVLDVEVGGVVDLGFQFFSGFAAEGEDVLQQEAVVEAGDDIAVVEDDCLDHGVASSVRSICLAYRRFGVRILPCRRGAYRRLRF